MARYDEEANTREEHHPGFTRRSVLQRAGWVVAGAAAFRSMADVAALAQGGGDLPNQITRAELPISDVMTRLSTYMSQARDRALPADILERTKRHTLDAFAAIVSGSDLVPGQVARAFAKAYGGKPVATIVGDTLLCGAIEAAMLNAMMGHADESDDWGPFHAGAVIVPAALAAGEHFGVSGAQFIRSVGLGYEIGTRVLNMVRPGLTNRHKPTYPIGGSFGSAAAAGCAAGLTAQQMQWALAYAAEQCSGITDFPRDPDHIEKAFMFAGMGARNGLTAALVVHAGWTGVNDVMTGTDNFLLRSKVPPGNLEMLVDKLGESYEIPKFNLKRWTVGAPIQQPLDAMEALLKRQPIDPEQVRDIVVQQAPGSITDNSGPVDINTQHALAVMLIDKTVTFRSIHDKARMKDPAILRLRTKTRLQAPNGTSQPLLQVTLVDGTRLSQDRVGAGYLGSVANPMNREQVVAKARDLMTPVLGAANTATLIDRVLAIEKVADIRELRPLLQRTPSGAPTLSEYPNVK